MQRPPIWAMTTPLAILFVLGIALFAPVEPPDRTGRVPAPPAKPSHAVEYRGPASDGGAVIVRRSGSWLWVRVAAEPTSNCRPDGWMRREAVAGESPRGVRGDGTFDLRGDYRTRARIQRGRRKELPQRLDNNPMRVTYAISGRFRADGTVSGSFTRRDRIHSGDLVARDCSRRSTWSARR